MTITARHALVTGGSRGIGRGIALKLAEHGVHVAINYLRDEASAKTTLEQVRARGSDGFTVQADVSQPADVERLFDRVGKEFGSLDIFVANARGEVGTFYESAMTIALDKWDAAMDSQARAFLVAVQKGEKLLTDGGRIIAISYTPGGGLWQLAVVGGHGRRQVRARGVVPLLRGGARTARHHRQRDQPRLDRRQRAEHAARAGAADDSRAPGGRLDADAPARHAGRHWQRGRAVLREGSRLDHRPGGRGRRRRVG